MECMDLFPPPEAFLPLISTQPDLLLAEPNVFWPHHAPTASTLLPPCNVEAIAPQLFTEKDMSSMDLDSAFDSSEFELDSGDASETDSIHNDDEDVSSPPPRTDSTAATVVVVKPNGKQQTQSQPPRRGRDLRTHPPTTAANLSVGEHSSVSAASSPAPPSISEDHRRRKRSVSKREPCAEEFNSQAEFQTAWRKWRQDRDLNNLSVKRSRQRAKMKRTSRRHEHHSHASSMASTVSSTPSPSALLQDAQIGDLRESLMVVLKSIRHPSMMSAEEQRQVRDLLAAYDGQQATTPASTTTRGSGKAR